MKKIIILVSLTLFLLVGISAYSEEPPPTKIRNEGQTESSQKQTKSKNQQHDTNNLPVSVKKIETNPGNYKIENYTNSHSNSAADTDWKFYFDLLLVFFTGILAISTILLWFYTKRAANAAKEAAETLPKIERAYVFAKVEEDKLKGVKHEATNEAIGEYGKYRRMFITIFFTNYGRTPAVIDELINYTVTVPINPTKLSTDQTTKVSPGTIVITSEKPFKHDLNITIPEDDWRDIAAGRKRLYCLGRIKYEITIGDVCETVFCWQYVPPDGGFALAAHIKSLNYRT